MDRANDEYATETFYDLKSSVFYNPDIKQNLSYSFLYTIAKTSKHDDSKTIKNKMKKFKKRRIINGCEMLKDQKGDEDTIKITDRIDKEKITILGVKKCTLYLKEKI